jgi:uncharacterized Zn finger protein (UPF0148 family)
MIGWFSGYSDSSTIGYCPACGEAIFTKNNDGSAFCNTCGMSFAVIEIDNGEDVDTNV